MDKDELLALLKDPDKLKELGLKKADDPIEELLKPIDFNDDMTAEDVVKMVNDRNVKLASILKDMDGRSKRDAEEIVSRRDKEAKQKEIDAFLEKHPELAKNKELMDVVSPLYGKTGDLKKAYEQGCKVLDLDPATGLAPKEESEKPKGDEVPKKTQLRSDTPSSSSDKEGEQNGDNEEPMSLMEILSEQANALAAKGENPFRK